MSQTPHTSPPATDGRREPTAGVSPPAEDGRMTVDELAARAGVSVRTVRFYAAKGMLPPPHLKGRLGLYDDVHLARLELVRDLQAKGFTLAAIETYLARVSDDATAEDIAVFRALLSPWVADEPARLTRAELEEAAGRPVDDEVVAQLEVLRVVETLDDGALGVRLEELPLGLQLVDLGAPMQMFVEARQVLDEHTGALAEELAGVLHRHLVRPYLNRDLPTEERPGIPQVIEQLKPLTVQTVVTAFEHAVDRAVRGRVSGR